ncbi:uncharacterized protein LOC142986255 [Anticarsia gemmatalis]|uniref:uncharacterized protein LOC142986255 n=1 Tax=Anticarsia gemmatalis TaxID=129554 RepID=UPI003F758E79
MSMKLDDPVLNIKEPKDYNYMKYMRFVLRIISSWPGREMGEKAMWFEGMYHAYFNTSLSLVYLVSGFAYLKIHKSSLTFLQIGHNYIVLLMNMLCTSRASTLCCSLKYRAVAKLFIEKMHLFYHKDKTDYALVVHSRMHRFSHYFCIYLTFLQFLSLFLFNLTPVFNNYLQGYYSNRKENLVNATFEHAIYFVFPWNSDSNFNGYIYASIINWVGSYLCLSSICMLDCFLSLMVFHLYGHFQILLHLLETFPIPAACKTNLEADPSSDIIVGSEIYSKTEQDVVTDKLKECIVYHLMIVDFVNNISDAFGPALAFYYFFYQVCGCLFLLEVAELTAEALARYLPITLVMYQQLIQMSVIFESIGAMSEKVKDAVYCLPWEYMNTKNRKTVHIFLINVQEPIHIHAGGLVSVGVQTMAAIIKTSFSYFAFLRTVE